MRIRHLLKVSTSKSQGNAGRRSFRPLGLLLTLALILNAALPVLAEDGLFLEPEQAGVVLPSDSGGLTLELSEEAPEEDLEDADWLDLEGLELEEIDLEDFSEPEEAPVEIASGNSNPEDFEIVDGVLKVYNGAGGDVVIPDGVTSIGNNAFRSCHSLTSISIPDGVTHIGYNAFYNCSNLTSISIPNSVTHIGYYAFGDCLRLTNISIPDSVTNIGNLAFSYCTSLTSISIPISVTIIGSEVFSECFSLKSISIPNSVTDIGEFAFYKCTSLTSVSIPDSVMRIEDGAFSGCTSLTNIRIPNSTTRIGWYSFSDCIGLTYISIPDSVTRIGGFSFYNCANLISVSIPDSVTSIESSAFRSCTGLTSVNIPDSVKSIESLAFCDCTSLTSINIPNSVKSIGNGAFSNCPNLTIYGEAGSYAERYANNHSIPFSIIPAPTQITPVTPTHAPVTPTELIANKLTLGVGEKVQILDPKSPVQASGCAFSSTNEAVATVGADGVVKAVGVGSADISATVDSVSTVCHVTVKRAPKSITLSSKALLLGVKESYTLTAKLPKNAAGAITWSVDNNSGNWVAIVDSGVDKNGTPYCTVRGKKKTVWPQEATITAHAYNGIKATCSVQVLPAPILISLPYDALTMGVGEPLTLNPSLSAGSASQLTWTSSKPKVVSVNAKGRIKALKKGTATITVKTFNGKTATCDISVKSAPKSIMLDKIKLKLRPYDTHALKATLSKNSGAIVRWKSSNKSVAKVNDNGMVTALKEGHVTITAYTWNKKKAICEIEVAPNSNVKYRALVIGQEKTYEAGDEPNFYKDATAMTKMLKKVQGPTGGNWSVTTKYDVENSQKALKLIRETFSGATSDDVSLFFISCHGCIGENKQEAGKLQLTNLEYDYLILSDLARVLKKVPGKIVVILASCHSGAGIYANGTSRGNATEMIQRAQAFDHAVIEAFASVDSGLYIDLQGNVMEAGELRGNTSELRKENKFYVLTACDYLEEGHFEKFDKRSRNKPTFFVQAIIDGVTKVGMPADSNEDKIITLRELYDYTSYETSKKAAKESRVQNVQVYPKSCGFGLFKKK